jgi:hypothetical protein
MLSPDPHKAPFLGAHYKGLQLMRAIAALGQRKASSERSDAVYRKRALFDALRGTQLLADKG